MTFKGSPVHQGDKSDDSEDLVMLICAKDDVRCHAEELGIKLSEDQLDESMEWLRRKGTDLLMDDFWQVLEVAINEVKDESK